MSQNGSKKLEQKCIHTIRGLAMDAVEKANSGHPGMPMGMADTAFVIWTEIMNHNPANPKWFNRDRFVLSAGHGSMLLYSLLHLTGYGLTLEDIKQFRQWNSKTPGHPEYGHTDGVETTTGPLGQGIANAVGMAMAEAHLSSRINPKGISVIDHYTYAIVSDGDLMEGISHEAASMAGHLKLGKLICYYDDNGITIDGPTNLSFSEDVAKRFEAYGWQCIAIDGHDTDAVRKATKEAKDDTNRPSLILCKTEIGYGSPNKQGSASSHGAPLGSDEIKLTKEKLGLDPDKSFQIDNDVRDYFLQVLEKGEKREKKWQQTLDEFEAQYPEKSKQFNHCVQQRHNDIIDILPEFDADEKGMATRKASGLVLDACMEHIPNLIGGSADLTPSNNTQTSHGGVYSSENYSGRYIHYGIREHAMWGAMNGMALHGCLRPYGGTFMIFSDYCRPSIRLAALSGIPVIGVFTHDSIGLGEDGPTHQPVEQLSSLRAIPNLVLIRPCDANETSFAWKVALEREDGPTLLALSRQNLPIFDRTKYASACMLEKGAYILKEADNEKPDLILIATGSEVQYALKAGQLLKKKSINARVVSMPSWELFRQQEKAYKESVLLKGIPKISIEAGTSAGWHEWIGPDGLAISLERFGASAPFEKIYSEFGFSPEKIADKAEKLLG